jgi:transposase
MTLPHSTQAKQGALALLAAGKSKRDVYRRTGIGENTLTRWAKRAGIILRDGRSRFGAGKRKETGS